METITAEQRAILEPIFRNRVSGWERMALDFGCGPGRFSASVAEVLGGRCVAVDPVFEFLAIAPPSDAVQYLQCPDGVLPLASETIDAVWICLVLGGITDADGLERIATELQRVMKEDAILFLVENTTVGKSAAHWIAREVEAYMNLFASVNLEHVADYREVDQRISILVGRKG